MGSDAPLFVFARFFLAGSDTLGHALRPAGGSTPDVQRNCRTNSQKSTPTMLFNLRFKLKLFANFIFDVFEISFTLKVSKQRCAANVSHRIVCCGLF